MMVQISPPSSLSLITCKEVIQRISISRSALYDRLNPSSPRHDPHCPRPVKVGSHRVAWVASEVDEYIKLLIQNRQ